MTVAQAHAAQLQQRISELMLENDNLDQDRAHAEKQCGILLVDLQGVKAKLLQLREQIDDICIQIDEIITR